MTDPMYGLEPPAGIVQFLEARIAEDEDLARRLSRRPRNRWLGVDPARVLAECKAKRAILDVIGDLNRHTDEGYIYDDLVKALVLPYTGHPDNPPWTPYSP